ncbi:FKBP-type peptidyl-prolyl cis-trans isomerase [Microbacterium dauci]|uniref:Peptidyl-prolyl cis-trans isomerase n=1 Tax=Microbacterium dauci TaxID=3048008 RepID=A0ABT6ZGH2_9MICO|nr:FKBP-type peptidyl-prolyl cis-trans isomerase [Microbacterium sp. LX3-4]MDJ1115251.1 FKBP-type peptidyl-prolyl cis-trans isomerase [Microbacterium sp. LX3-4]
MRQIPAAIAVLGLSALALVGCAASDSSSTADCEPTTASSSALDLIDVSGDFGTPEVTTSAPVHVEETSATELIEGDGLAVTSRAQDVVFTTTVLNGTTGQQLVSSGTVVQPVTQWAAFAEGVASMLHCATEGSRIVGAIAPEDISEQAAANLQLSEGDSAIFVIDLEKVYLSAADGAPQYVDGSGIPTVVLATDGRPGIIVPDAPAPKDLIVKTLKKGDGEEIQADSIARVNYTGVLWDNGEVFDSSWEKGASTAFGLDGVVPGFAQALEGQTVGSQVLAVIPPELGYGETAQGAIPAGSTLVFVIDILGIDESAPIAQ